MSYRTILVYLDDDARTRTRIGVAAALARAHQSHLIGLAPSGRSEIPGSPWPPVAGPEFQHFSLEALIERARRVAGDCAQQAKELEVPSFDTHVDAQDPTPSMIQHAACADLLVIGQADHRAPTPAVPWAFPQHVILCSGRPVLLVPIKGEFPVVGSRVLVAWNGSREATRAIFDALPLLRAASAVQVVVFDEEDLDHGPSCPRPQPEHLLGWLARHSVIAGLSREPHRGRLGRQLLHKVSEQGADLLVMGCYGHSRLTELVLGGATRAVLADMQVPVLMSH
ncbi:universal stress protein [Aquabacterium sp. A7-Y]|uniref:universal stress protein n=1 Tax=Aquabacterium sp. A7-Y TaxID=1349605 RepID=UPI00223D575B|nr:universal stress protein [Aquabacterium sp. A7-Y]MCW7540897.1 universal stress protein [Aquabacterium sp. A7-Y]